MKQTFWQQSEKIIGPATVADFDEIGQKETRNAIETFILDHVVESTKLLDAGCNTGVEGYRLFNKGFSGYYVGVDSNVKALAHALGNLQNFQATFCLADLENMPFHDGHFDIVLNKDVIEHAEYYTSILAELARLTRQWLILSMFIRMHDQPDFIHREPQGFHHNRYQRSKLYEFMTGKGFGDPTIIFQAGEDEVLVFRKHA